MVKILKFAVLSLTLLLNSSSAININCNFNNETGYAVLGHPYQCVLQDNLSTVTRENLVIESVTGTHVAPKTNDDVIAFHAYNKGIQAMPQGLEKVFTNLRAILINLSKIQDIRRSDLSSLPNLWYIQILDSEIQFVEDGAFDFNPNLQVVWLFNNKIFHLDSNLFKDLDKLSWLSLTSNACINSEVAGDLIGVKALINTLEVSCFDNQFYEFKQNVENLEFEGKLLNSENFQSWTEKLNSLEAFFKNSRFSNLIYFKEKFANLRETYSSSSFSCQLQFCTSVDEKLNRVFGSLQDQIQEIKQLLVPTGANSDN